MKKFSIALASLLFPALILAQNSVSGTVTDATSGQALAGANVVLEGTSLGAAADADGSYTITDVPNGTYTVTASVIGYARSSQSVDISSDATVNFSMRVEAVGLQQVEVVSSRSDERAPVAFTTVTKQEMQLRLASRDIPMALETIPGV